MSAVKLPPPVVVHSARASAARLAEVHVGSTKTLLEVLPPRPRSAPDAAPPRAATTPAAAPPILVRPVTSPLFRDEALRAYRLGQRLSAPLRVVPLSTSALLTMVGCALLAALLIAGLGSVDLTARGRGTIRMADGLQPLRFEIEGVVRQVLVSNGAVVQRGQLLLRLDSTRLAAALVESETQLSALRERTTRDAVEAEARYRRDSLLLDRRARLMRARIESQRKSIAEATSDQARYRELTSNGVVALKTVHEGEALLSQQQREQWSLEDELARVGQQVAELEQTHRAGLSRRAHELQEAAAHVEAARRMLAQTELRATHKGRIESLAAAVGDVVGPALVVAQLVSLETERSVVAFVPERERAFVRAGLPVRLELDQLPVGEFGSARGVIVRAASEVASPAELERALGAAAPDGVHFATYIAVEPNDARSRALLERVGSGTLLTVRMPVRKRRILSLLFDPVRKWLD